MVPSAAVAEEGGKGTGDGEHLGEVEPVWAAGGVVPVGLAVGGMLCSGGVSEGAVPAAAVGRSGGGPPAFNYDEGVNFEIRPKTLPTQLFDILKTGDLRVFHLSPPESTYACSPVNGCLCLFISLSDICVDPGRSFYDQRFWIGHRDVINCRLSGRTTPSAHRGLPLRIVFSRVFSVSASLWRSPTCGIYDGDPPPAASHYGDPPPAASHDGDRPPAAATAPVAAIGHLRHHTTAIGHLRQRQHLWRRSTTCGSDSTSVSCTNTNNGHND